LNFSNPKTFPLLRRSTGIGIVNISARFLTSLSPFVAEFQAPYPTIIIIVTSVIGFFTSFAYPSYSEELGLPVKEDPDETKSTRR
jgi:hypothetical protein